MKKVSAVGYVRISLATERGASCETQEGAIRAYAQLHNLSLHGLLKDEGESGKDLNRPAAQRLLKLIRTRAIGAVVVYKLDRLTRSPHRMAQERQDVRMDCSPSEHRRRTLEKRRTLECCHHRRRLVETRAY